MTQGTVGWLCPKCGRISSPYEAVCTVCVPTIKLGFGTISGWAGTIHLGNVTYSGVTSGTIYAAPQKTDAQKLAEACTERDKYKREAEKYSAWADKIVEFYGQLNDLTEKLDDLTDEPDEIESE